MKTYGVEPLMIRKYSDKILIEESIKIGFTAPQIGIAKILIVAEVKERTIKLANPEILKLNATDRISEGCLSVPDFTVQIERPYEYLYESFGCKDEMQY